MILPYTQFPIEPSSIVSSTILYRPMALLRVTGPRSSRQVFALLDTGADHCMLPLSVAESIGLLLDENLQEASAGVGGHELTMIPGEVEFEIVSNEEVIRWSAVVGFADFDDPENEAAILGHAGCLEFFHANFDGQQREVELLPSSHFPGAVLTP